MPLEMDIFACSLPFHRESVACIWPFSHESTSTGVARELIYSGKVQKFESLYGRKYPEKHCMTSENKIDFATSKPFHYIGNISRRYSILFDVCRKWYSFKLRCGCLVYLQKTTKCLSHKEFGLEYKGFLSESSWCNNEGTTHSSMAMKIPTWRP